MGRESVVGDTEDKNRYAAEFFALRSCYEKRRAMWSSILDESVMYVIPITLYLSFTTSEV